MPGTNCGVSPGVFVKILNPHRMSFDSLESSSDAVVRGFLGISHAVTIVVRAEIKGPLKASRVIGPLSSSRIREHDKLTRTRTKVIDEISRVIKAELG